MVNVPYALSKFNGVHGPGDRIAAIGARTTIEFHFFGFAAVTATVLEHGDDAYKLSSRRVRLCGFARSWKSHDMSCLWGWGWGSNTRDDESAEGSNGGEFLQVMHRCVYYECKPKMICFTAICRMEVRWSKKAGCCWWYEDRTKGREGIIYWAFGATLLTDAPKPVALKSGRESLWCLDTRFLRGATAVKIWNRPESAELWLWMTERKLVQPFAIRIQGHSSSYTPLCRLSAGAYSSSYSKSQLKPMRRSADYQLERMSMEIHTMLWI